MSAEAIVRILREALLLVLLLSGGPMLASMLVGFIVSVFQATTQIQEQTLSYVPKLIAVFLTIAILGPWMLTQAVRFTRILFDSILLVR
ncbi:MAG: flagellar biosynthesis protein FliQ [Bryobacteraceae bacterium]